MRVIKYKVVYSAGDVHRITFFGTKNNGKRLTLRMLLRRSKAKVAANTPGISRSID